jgi:site-specific recombinase XerD
MAGREGREVAKDLAADDAAPAGPTPKVIPKTIRHTVASHLRNSGVPGEQISALLGHKDEDDTLETTSEIYAHVDPVKMKATIRALTKLWSRWTRKPPSGGLSISCPSPTTTTNLSRS